MTNASGLMVAGNAPAGTDVQGLKVCLKESGAVGTTAATFRSLTASKGLNSVILRWKTASEADVLGYNVYCNVKGKRVKLNRSLIAGKGLAGGRVRLQVPHPEGQESPGALLAGDDQSRRFAHLAIRPSHLDRNAVRQGRRLPDR